VDSRRVSANRRKLDAVINNAGYGHFGTVEELSEDDIRGQLEKNCPGATQGLILVVHDMDAARAGARSSPR
jgi:short-subunit dehydrogenase